jgi:mannose-6-phosphate isomerase-like protein (cupin superfamily)
MAEPEILNRGEREPFRTKDGSTVTELVHPDFSGASGQSVAEAVVAPGGETDAHVHRRSQEIYLFTSGAGRMALGGAEFDVAAGDSVVIAPGTAHKLWNPGDEDLVLLCVCAPAYSHEDTVLIGG